MRISGYELWKIDNDGLIANSKGRFDSAEYERRLKQGTDCWLVWRSCGEIDIE